MWVTFAFRSRAFPVRLTLSISRKGLTSRKYFPIWGEGFAQASASVPKATPLTPAASFEDLASRAEPVVWLNPCGAYLSNSRPHDTRTLACAADENIGRGINTDSAPTSRDE